MIIPKPRCDCEAQTEPIPDLEKDIQLKDEAIKDLLFQMTDMEKAKIDEINSLKAYYESDVEKYMNLNKSQSDQHNQALEEFSQQQ